MASKQDENGRSTISVPNNEVLRPIAEVLKALEERIDESLLKKLEDFTYVPWEVTARQLDKVFGPFGWSEHIVSTTFDTERGIYAAVREVTGMASGPDGRMYAIARTGVGRAIAVASKATGEVTARAHDTAIAAADSDSFSRAAKKLGDAFGLYLYEKSTSEVRPANGDAKPAGNGTSKYPPSAAQMNFLHKLGYKDEDIAKMPYKTWKGILDNRTQAPTSEPDEDELPF